MGYAGAHIDGKPLWEATSGEVVMSKTAFLAEVQSFDERFIAAMSEHVHAVKTDWSSREIAIDIASLENEQRYSKTLFENATGNLLNDFEWDDVRASIAAIDAHFNSEGV